MEEVVPRLRRPVPSWMRLLWVFGLLYGFLAGVKALESGIQALGSGAAESLFQRVSAPVPALFAGILATVLVQSSSVTTSMIVGLVGAGSLSVAAAVPMVMGANVGTTITNTLASMGHLRRGAEFQRAFAGATIHDVFNLLSVMVLLPLELATGFLSKTATVVEEAIRGGGVGGAGPASSPIKNAVGAPAALVESGLHRLAAPGRLLGILLIGFGMILIFAALALITRTMRELMAGRIERSLNTILGRGAGAGAMLVGVLVTVLVQSSSITTSILIPMVAAGILTLDNAYPVTLGANVGTTVTALLASVAAERPEALTIALTHTFFNLAGILLFYPIPAMRRIPLATARHMAAMAVRRRWLVFVYIIGVFVVVPIVVIVFVG